MKKTAPTSHPISGLFSLLLFGLFVLFLLIMLLFSAQIYQQSIKKADSETDPPRLQLPAFRQSVFPSRAVDRALQWRDSP